MSISRKEFFRKGCISGACLCGFGSLAMASNMDERLLSETKSNEENSVLVQEWISMLISGIESELDEESQRKVLKKASAAHYNHLKMDEMLSEYIGDIEKFIKFIEDKWGWRIEYDKKNKVLIADENKNYCVCPILDYKPERKYSAMCYCSEGFAEKMFSTVSGVAVSAKVIESIRKGGERCKYEIQLA